MPQNRNRHSITDASGNAIEGISDLSPPPSVVQLVKDNYSADSEWKKWLYFLYEYVGTLNQAIENMSTDIMFDIPAGNIAGQSSVNKFGASSSVADGVAEEIWDGATAYTWPTTASITHVRADTDSAATQGMVIEVQGLDTDYTLVVQTATLHAADSTTEVALTTALRRVFRIKITDASVADQDIWAGPTGFASKQAIVTAGNNQTLMALYTVPASKTAYITNYYCSIIGEAGPPATVPDYVLFRLWNRDNVNGYAPQLKHEVGSTMAGTSAPPHEFAPYLKATEKTDIWLEATPDGDDAYVSAGFDLILVDN